MKHKQLQSKNSDQQQKTPKRFDNNGLRLLTPPKKIGKPEPIRVKMNDKMT